MYTLYFKQELLPWVEMWLHVGLKLLIYFTQCFSLGRELQYVINYSKFIQLI